MSSRIRQVLWQRWRVLAVIALLGGYWLIPVSGQVQVRFGPRQSVAPAPEMHLVPAVPASGRGAVLQVTDVAPWAHVLLTVNGQALHPERIWAQSGTWSWQWSLPAAAGASGDVLVFYRDCHTGCRERGRLATGPGNAGSGTLVPAPGLPTKLGVAFANPGRDWHGRSAWDVEVTYARLAAQPYWGIDDLATRVQAAQALGLRVLVRVDFDRGQSLPPAGSYPALSDYLAYLQRLARDDRLRGVYGYIIGSGFNALDANSLAPAQPVSPGWYARLFNGYGEPASRTDNVVQTIRRENAQVRVLVGPVRPWNSDQDGDRPNLVAVPWLNYMNTLTAALDEGAQAKAAAGIALAAADGFALQAPGRPEAPELAGRSGAEEPRLSLPRATWRGAQAGFRVYQDWLAIINRYPTTRGLPAYITAGNTFAPDDGTPPSQNYPRGWLTAALAAINGEPQVHALCWFLDGPLGDSQWEGLSLSRRQGHMAEAADEFDALLRGGS